MSEKNQLDPMSQASDKPNLAALQTEYENAWTQTAGMTGGVGTLTRAEDARYCRWAGQSFDGRRYGTRAKAARPYEGAPDTRIPLVDDTINKIVAMLMVAFWSARINPVPTHTSKLTAQEAAEVRAVIKWLMRGALFDTLADQVEFCAQIGQTMGWAVLHPSWVRRESWVKQKLTLDQVLQFAGQAPPGSVLAQAPGMVMDPELEDAAVELFQSIFADEDGEARLDAKEARRIVRELRDSEDHTAEFAVPKLVENRPELEVLVPGVDFVSPVEMTFLQQARVLFHRKYFSEADIEIAAHEDPNNPWDARFVEKVKQTAGVASDLTITEETERDDNARNIEIVTAYARQVKDGVPGIYCTVFSPNLVTMGIGRAAKVDSGGTVRPVNNKGKAEAGLKQDGGGKVVTTTGPLYAAHFLLDGVPNQYPFPDYRTEVVGKRPGDARGVPERLVTQQGEIKTQRDGLFIYAELSITPPLKRLGTRASKLPPELGPLGVLNVAGGGDWQWFPPPPGNPQIAFELIAAIRQEAESAHGIASAANPPALAAPLQQRAINRFLTTWARAFWQLGVLCYQNLSPEELEEVIGHKPLMTAEKLMKHTLHMYFDARGLDAEWVKEMIAEISQIIQMDTGGTFDHSKLVQILASYLDPTLADEISTNQEGAAQAVFKDVRGEVGQIMQGNEAQYVENDPTAKMKLQFLQQIVGANPDYTKKLHPQSPEYDERKAKLLEKYTANLGQSVTQQQNKQVGRLGVKPEAMDKAQP